MRSNSRNFLLSASASRSDDEQPQSAQPISSINAGQQQMAMPGHQQFGYAMGSNGNSVPLLGQGLPRTGQHLQPSLGDLYCQVQELEIRLRHLEIFVFANPNIMRTLPVAPTNIMNPQSSHDDLNFGPTNEGQTSENHHDKNIHVSSMSYLVCHQLSREEIWIGFACPCWSVSLTRLLRRLTTLHGSWKCSFQTCFAKSCFQWYGLFANVFFFNSILLDSALVP